jgi:hypothetical protein
MTASHPDAQREGHRRIAEAAIELRMAVPPENLVLIVPIELTDLC